MSNPARPTTTAPAAADDASTGAGDKLIFAPPAATFDSTPLTPSTLAPSPITQFHTWFTTLQTLHIPQPETCVLSTSHLPSGRVSSRTVYLKSLTPRGFTIFTNLSTSRKSADLRSNPWAALNFHWRETEQQVRVEGRVEFCSRAENEEYFATRGRESQIGAHASRQSAEIEGREVLERWVREEEERWGGKEVECPEGWGGVRVVPVCVEFWKGRRGRLHDRFVYEREDTERDVWTVKRLSP